mmetsp:Transcript_2513/g.4647  ORF Transcript_2513/g.4647 Transcript_2513/m.4647 type:complete len:438 (+) Transcript_2513:2379-3692(+)
MATTGRGKGGGKGKGRGGRRPVICANCHEGGHFAYDCPKRPDTANGDNTADDGPSAPCIWCEEMHWSYACPVAAQRRSQGVCLKCGDPNHWVKACPKYREGAQRPDTPNVWCMRCGTTKHSTSRCTAESGAPIHMPTENDDIHVCLWCGIAGHDFSECFRRVPSQTKEHATKITELEKHINAEIAPLKKAVENISGIKDQLGTLTDRVAALETWRTASAPHLDEMKKQTASFQDMLQDFPQWKKKVEATQKAQKTKFDSFLDTQWKPMNAQFQELLTEWQRPEKRQRSDDLYDLLLNSEEERDVELDDERNNAVAIKMSTSSGSRDPPETPKRQDRKKLRTDANKIRGPDRDPWLDIPLGDAAWTEELMDALMGDWQPAYHDRLLKWLRVHSTSEMVETVESLATAETTRIRDSGLKQVLKGARVSPMVFSNRPRQQ